MKKLYILLFFVGGLLGACDSVKDLQPARDLDEAIPMATINAIKQNYPEATKVRFSTIERNRIFQSDFDVRVERMSAVVNHLGVISEMYRQTAVVTLPDNIKTFLASNYPNAAIINVSQQINRDAKIEGYRISIKEKEGKSITLMFDTTGTLIMLVTDDRTPPPVGTLPPKLYFIDRNELPVVIKDFLTKKYDDFRFIKVGVIIENDAKNYSVVIGQNLTTYDYLFDEKGNILKFASFGINAPTGRIEDKPLTISDLTNKIKVYLDKEYKGWQFERGVSFSQNGIVQVYNVLITYDRKQFSIQFDGESNFLKREQIGSGGNDNKYDVKLIQPRDLPITISIFLASKHKDFRYIQAAIITDKGKKIYWVTILNNNNITFDYTFDDKGVLLNMKEIAMKFPENKITDKPLEQKDVPSKAKDYLDTNYKFWVFQKGIVAYIENKILGYIVAIKVGNEYYYVSFDANAAFISARRG